MTNFQRIAAYLDACGKEHTAAEASYQMGDLLWSIVALLEATTVSGPQSEDDIATAIKRLRRTGGAMRRGQTLALIKAENRVAALQAICDIDARCNAVACVSDMDKDAADAATLNAVDAMLVDGAPVLAPGRKIVPPEGWEPADVSRFV